MTKLPVAIHLITQAPELDIVGISGSILGAQVSIQAACGTVAVFHPVTGFFRGAGTQVNCHHRGPAHLA